MGYRFITRTLTLAAFVVLAGCLGTIDSPGADSATGQRTIQVSATGEATGEPDQAVVTLGVSAVAASADDARTHVAANVSTMRTALRDADVADDQIQTVSFFIGEERVNDETDSREFRATHLFRLTLTDIESVGSVIDTAIENGATNVQGVQFTLSTERSRELRAIALEDAMENARGQADTLASAASLSITGVQSVETGEVSVGPVFQAAALSAETTIEPGPVTVTAQVRVVYNATA
ncbi:SIMPL domain-containing protein [Haladaptatus sp. DJG-WS-42]|uniref:SIMPL domain-containing protein n=1 Tax=Haladaptatus sp. DJG-WS-42 TaxID=3120516 RepID=UPI0030D429BF